MLVHQSMGACFPTGMTPYKDLKIVKSKEASAKVADTSLLMRKIGFVVVLLRGLHLLCVIFDEKEAPMRRMNEIL